jgi:DNA-directed RNA polymerase subunit L
MTLEPCDIIATGTPAGVGFAMKPPRYLQNGDVVRIEIEGEGHTFCNVLQKALLEDETVETASYDIPHPLVSSPIVYVRMKEIRKPEKRPETALKDSDPDATTTIHSLLQRLFFLKELAGPLVAECN